MPTTWTPLSPTTHAHHNHHPRTGFAFAKTDPIVPVLFVELPKLIPHYVLGFVKDADSYQLVALTGTSQKNLYVDQNNKWLADYVPAALRGYPFQLAKQEDGRGVLCVAERQLCDKSQGEPLFDSEGDLTDTLIQTRDFLLQREHNRLVTVASIERLQHAGVIQPWALSIEQGEGLQAAVINGFYAIDENALNALDAETYHSLKGAPMALAYGQLYTMSQTNQLTLRAQYHAQHSVDTSIPADASDFFKDDETLRFNF